MIKKIKRLIAIAVFKIVGWKFEGQLSGAKKQVIVMAPHTSNWDFPVMIAASWYFGVKISWVGKQEMFNAFWPLKQIYLMSGGIPVDRKKSNNLVSKLSTILKEADELHLCIPPEGTRGKRSSWKSGFYYIALEAGVPITLSYLDFRNKIAGIGISFMPTGNADQDIIKIRDFYAPIRGKHPSQQSPILFKPSQVENNY